MVQVANGPWLLRIITSDCPLNILAKRCKTHDRVRTHRFLRWTQLSNIENQSQWNFKVFRSLTRFVEFQSLRKGFISNNFFFMWLSQSTLYNYGLYNYGKFLSPSCWPHIGLVHVRKRYIGLQIFHIDKQNVINLQYFNIANSQFWVKVERISRGK